MANGLKIPTPGTDPITSDVGQFVLLLQALADVGLLQLAGPQTTPTVPTVAASGTAGNLNGAYIYKVVTVTGWPQSDGSYYVSGFVPSAATSPVTITNNSANIMAIAVGTGPTIARAIYRTAAGGAAGTEKFVGIIWDNVTTSFVDNLADPNLGTGMPGSGTIPAAYGTAIPANVPTGNTTGTWLNFASLPANTPVAAAGTVANINGQLCMSNGTVWLPTGSSPLTNPLTYAL